MEKIVQIETDVLYDHPKQTEVYGEVVVEPEFVASIKDMGIITPLVVAKRKEGGYTIISGHRRHRAAIEAGLERVPCLIKQYENEEMMELEFLAANMQREKTKRARLKEFLHHKQILCQIGKIRKGQGVYANTIYVDEHFSRICKTLKIDNMIEPGEPIDSVEILKKITNYSKYEQEMLTVLYSDDWLQRVYDEFRSKNVAESTLEQISAIVEMMRSRYEAEEISLNEAAKSVREMVADVRRRLEQKHNRTQMKAQKESQRSKPKKAEERASQTLALAVNVGKLYIEPKIKFSEVDAVAELYWKREDIGLGVMRNDGMVTGFAMTVGEQTYIINPEVLVKLIKRSI